MSYKIRLKPEQSLNENYYIPVNINDYIYDGDLYGIGLIYIIKDKVSVIGQYVGVRIKTAVI